MNQLQVFVILALVAATFAMPQRTRGSSGDCAFGKEYYDGCNHCVCHGNSGSTCTRLPSCSTSTKSPVVVDVIRGDKSRPFSRRSCPRGDEYMEDCNVCTCHGDQGYICTKKECYNARPSSSSSGTGTNSALVPVIKGVGSSTTYQNNKKQGNKQTENSCVVGHQYNRGCDVCTCFGEYFGYRCTKSPKCDVEYITQGLADAEKGDSGTRGTAGTSDNKCTRGNNYSDGRFYCVCRKDRKGYVCTDMVRE